MKLMVLGVLFVAAIVVFFAKQEMNKDIASAEYVIKKKVSNISV